MGNVGEITGKISVHGKKMEKSLENLGISRKIWKEIPRAFREK